MSKRSAPRAILVSVAFTTFAVATFASQAREARADDSPLGLSLSLERVAGVAYSSIRPTSSSTSYSVTSFTLAGAAINPIALPRVGADVILPMGLTLGGAVAYGTVSLSTSPNQGQSSSESGHAWLLSPRIGYRAHLSPLFDLIPRIGVTLAGASLTSPDGQSCTFAAGGTTSSCTTTPGDQSSLTLVAASLELAAALRLTKSFNLLGGFAYDHVLSASGSTDSANGAGGRTTQDLNAQGKYLGTQLWFGLGGYIL